MGIYDRDYVRPGRGAGGSQRAGLPRLGTLSVTTWLLIINIAVFVVDALVPPSNYVAVACDRVVDPNTFNRATAVYPKAMKAPPNVVPGALYKLPIVDSKTGLTVGEQRFRFMPPLTAWGHFSSGKAFFGLEVWRFITFQFLHADITHLVFNMMGVFFFGPLVEQHLRTRRRFLSFYLACGIFGSLTYLLFNLVGTLGGLKFAPFLFDDMFMPLVGASAGIFGILMAAARFAGDGTMLVFMVIPMRISTGAYLMAAAAAANLILGGKNAGGDAAHVGGAIAGFIFVRNMHLLRDFLDIFGKSPAPRPARPGDGESRQRKLDAILQKVHDEGLHSLSPAEQKFLQQQSDERRPPAR